MICEIETLCLHIACSSVTSDCAGPESAEALTRLGAVGDDLTSRLLERHRKGASGMLAQESLAALAAANASLAALQSAAAS